MSRHATEFDWTPEAIERLRTMAAAGYTAGQIALVFGLSRNSVCGQLKRKHIERGVASAEVRAAATIHQPATKSRAKPRSEWKPRAPRKPKEHHPLPTLARPAKPRALPPDEPTTATAVTTKDIAPGQCKWVITADAPFLHCGAQQVPGRPWCEHHLAKVFSVGTRSERSAA